MRVRTIVFPWLKPALALAVLVRALDTIRVFDLFYGFAGGEPGGATATLGLLAYRDGFMRLEVGRACAVMILTLAAMCAVAVAILRRAPAGGIAPARRAGFPRNAAAHVTPPGTGGVGSFVRWTAQAAAAGIFGLPFAWLIVMAFNSRQGVFSEGVPFEFTPANFIFVLAATPFPRHLLTSVVVALSSAVLAAVFAVPCAYAVARRAEWGGGRMLGRGLVAARLIPPLAIALPGCAVLRASAIPDATLALIAFNTAVATAVGIWFLTGLFRQVPVGLDDAATVDGLGPWRILFRVGLRLVRPGIGLVTAIGFVLSFNEFAFALAVSCEGTVTAPVALATLREFAGYEWGHFAAGAVLFLLPTAAICWFAVPHWIEALSKQWRR